MQKNILKFFWMQLPTCHFLQFMLSGAYQIIEDKLKWRRIQSRIRAPSAQTALLSVLINPVWPLLTGIDVGAGPLVSFDVPSDRFGARKQRANMTLGLFLTAQSFTCPAVQPRRGAYVTLPLRTAASF